VAFFIFVLTDGVDDLVPRLRIVEAAGADLPGDAIVENLADAGDEVAGRVGTVGARVIAFGQVLAEVGGIFVNLWGRRAVCRS